MIKLKKVDISIWNSMCNLISDSVLNSVNSLVYILVLNSVKRSIRDSVGEEIDD